MTGYFLKTLLARVKTGKSLYLLTVGGVALGVASVLCIQIINQNALAAFVGSMKAVSGEADFSLVGRTPTLPEEIYPEVLATAGVAAAWPLYRLDVSLSDHPGQFLEVLGVDLFTPFRLPLVSEHAAASQEDPGGRVRDEVETQHEGGRRHEEGSPPQQGWEDILAAALTQPGWVAVVPAYAEQMGWSVGDSIRVSSGSRTASLVVGALVDFQKYAPLASRKLAVMDIAQAQGLLGQPGGLHQIDVQLAVGAAREEVIARLISRFGPMVRAVTPEQR